MTSAENYELLIGKINIFIRKYYFNNFLRGLIFLGAGIFTAYVVITLGEYFGNFNILFRTILFYAFIILNLGLICWLILPPLLSWLKLGSSLTHDEAAEIIGRHFHDVNDKLLNTLQLKKLAVEDERHRALIEASIDQKIESLKPVSFPSAINIRENTKYLKWILAPVAVIVVIAFAAPSILTESTRRLIRHNEYFVPAAPFKFNILNKTLSVVQGDDLRLDLKLDGDKLPADVYVETANNTFKLDKENISRFHYLFTNLQQNTRFKLSGNGFTSAQYEIKVNQKPALLHFDVDLSYPAYLHKKNEILINAGDLVIPAGTAVKWQLHTQHATGLTFFMNDVARPATSNGADLFEHSEKIYKNSVYKLSPINSLVNHSDSATYHINVIADEAPVISVQEKPDSVSMNSLYFTGKIQDDHGFSSLNFHYIVQSASNKGASKTFVKRVDAAMDQTQSDFFYFWNLKGMGINPGDQVTYFFEVADNDGVNGPKKARTPEHTLNMPDTKQINEQLNAGTQAVKQKMQSAIKLAGQVEHDSQKLNQLLLNKNTLSFDEKKQVEDLLQKKKDLEDLVKEIKDDNKKNLYNRQENQKQSEEILAKQKQIEDLFNNVLDQKTKELLQNLQQLLNEQQKDATRDELSKMQMDNKSLKKELDRMLELYKKLDFDQKLNQSIDQLNKLADKEQKLADKTQQQGAESNALQQEQNNLKKDFQDVKKGLDELQKQNEQAERKSDFENPEKETKDIDQQMDQSKDELQKNNKSKASKSQQQAAKQMQQLASKLQKDNDEGESQDAAIDAQQLRELLKNLVNSSFNQEKLMQTLKSTSPTDPGYITLSQSQKDIKDNLKTAEDSLYAISRRIPQIQSTVNKEITSINSHIDDALENLGDRRTAEANRNQQYAMTSMNNLALMLSEALQQMQDMANKGKGGKGKSKSAGQLSKMQQQLNQNMQKARDQMQQQGNPGKGKQGNQGNMSEQFAKMARQQQMIRQSLEQLNREENKDGKGGLGNLDKISKEMEQTEHDLVNRKITDEALKRQQQIQSRLLEAEKAEQEREQDQQRESHAGKDIPPGYIKALQGYQQQRVKQTEQVKTVSPALNLYYKQKIKSYFDQLNAK
ncbi:hypothetical protein SAMN05216464_10996 [Mucilaginibacter pineti]|uniref:Uncharacterized protein n=1 Tax=Mucilaginibacter pineti TaxID=1391627 RepID=A0A1G7FK86_9SPHI|nr:DUF4175 family protein [Mucilaginibacter pineti]SDE76308.1 hypothetical protein SAMN05216464_10996 [Mucilaginibacter pineti]